jgi:hypothetical protein
MFMVLWLGFVLLLPIHTIMFLYNRLATYVQMLFYLSTEPLHHHYQQELEMYEAKTRAIRDFDALL